MSNLKAAKSKANEVVRKASSGAKSLSKGASGMLSGLSRFDYKIYNEA